MGSERDYSHHTRNARGKHGDDLETKREEDRRNAIRALDRASRMTIEDASRIQSRADKTGANQDFKSRAMSAAARNERERRENE
jgi:hypothetical protein